MRRASSFLALLLLLLGGSRLASAQGAASVQIGSSIAPDTVTVGDPFIVRIRVRAPQGSMILFPDVPDTSGTVQALDPRAVRDTTTAAGVESNAVYRLAAWDTGPQPLGLADVVVRAPGGEQRISLADLRVIVKSVLPADSTQRVPKPARPIIELPRSLWWLWLALLALAVIAGLLVWWWRRRRARGPVPAIDPLVLAQQEFARVEAMGLVEAGERGRFVALMVEVLRDYLARRVDTPQSLTSSELVEALRARGGVPLERLAPLLTETDLVKFARYQVSAERARQLAREAREVTSQVQAATEPQVDEPPAEPARDAA